MNYVKSYKHFGGVITVTDQEKLNELNRLIAGQEQTIKTLKRMAKADPSITGQAKSQAAIDRAELILHAYQAYKSVFTAQKEV